MSDDDIKDLIQLAKIQQAQLAAQPVQVQEPVAIKHDIVDSLSKVGIALCTAAILYVAGQLQNQDRKLIQIDSNQKHLQAEVEKVSDFTKAPRFTHDDFKLEMRLYDSRITLIENELRVRSNFMSETNKRLGSMPE